MHILFKKLKNSEGLVCRRSQNNTKSKIAIQKAFIFTIPFFFISIKIHDSCFVQCSCLFGFIQKKYFFSSFVSSTYSKGLYLSCRFFFLFDFSIFFVCCVYLVWREYLPCFASASSSEHACLAKIRLCW